MTGVDDRASVASAVIAVSVLPGMVAFAVPLSIAAGSHPPMANGWGLVLVALGTSLLASTVRGLFSVGRGTLAPWNPPRRLVTTGPYRWCRNPMYVAVLTIASGWALVFSSTSVAVYTSALAVGFHLRVVLVEEAWAERTFGSSWTAYRARVPRWVPHRMRPITGPS